VRVRGRPRDPPCAPAVPVAPEPRLGPAARLPGTGGRARGPHPVSALYVRARTKGGIEGLYGPIDAEVVPVLLRDLRPFLVGRDALAVEELWDRMHRQNRHGRAGHFMMATSAADNVLWDVRGRLLGVPVFRLLGGGRGRVQVYASCLGFSLEPGRARRRRARCATRAFERRMVPRPRPGRGPARAPRERRPRAPAPEAVGEETDLMFDAFMGWDLPYAPRVGEGGGALLSAVDRGGVPARRDGELRRAARRDHGPGRFRRALLRPLGGRAYLEAKALHVVQADPEWCGGTSELVRIAALASAHDAHLVPHGHSLHAALHVVASQSPRRARWASTCS